MTAGTTKSENFIANLQAACSSKRSIAQICREIGINRQQFSRYLTGESKPSNHNRARLAAYFGLSSADFDLPSRQFQTRFHKQSVGDETAPEWLGRTFPGDLTALRPYLGYYQSFHTSPSWPGKIIRSLTRLSERNGWVVVKSIERIRDKGREIHQFSKYTGLASYAGDRIFIVEKGIFSRQLISETVLMPFETYERVYLKGMTFGLSWRRSNLPYASRMIWRRLPAATELREALRQCEALPADSRQVPLTVRKYFQDTVPEMMDMAEV